LEILWMLRAVAANQKMHGKCMKNRLLSKMFWICT
jgi:hypothetical protein